MKAKLKQSELIAYAVKDFIDNKIREKDVEFAIQIASKYSFIGNTLVTGADNDSNYSNNMDLISVGKLFDLPFKNDMYLWRNWTDWVQSISSEFARKNNMTLVTKIKNGATIFHYVALENVG